MAKTLTMYQVDAFTDQPFAGNPAAVLVLDEALDEPLMKAIAEENNLSETAYAVATESGYHLRWFTPTHEAAFCGHATLATAHVLAQELGRKGPFCFQTQVGELIVTPETGAYGLDLPAFAPEVLSPEPAWVAELFPGGVRAVFKNFENMFVELGSEAEVRAFIPNLAALAEIYDIDLCITAEGEEADFVSRYFAPRAGIPEDPVTGSTHATLVPYWAERLGKSSFKARQVSPRGGSLSATLLEGRVRLEGQAVTFLKGTITLG
ncbi:MAG: PhzF family phenazine biosynthesis protein [Pseudomonadota bacterium]